MTRDQSISWVGNVIHQIPEFLEKMRDRDVPGRYKYSLTGDIVTNKKWGLGNTVFAVKCYHMLNLLDQSNIENMVAFIKSFQNKNTQIFDPVVQKLSQFFRLYTSLWRCDWRNISGEMTRRAETRQSFAALRALGSFPDKPCVEIPYSEKGIHKYIHSLNWNKPYEAGSHFGHLVFLIYNNYKMLNYHAHDQEKLINYSFNELNNFKQTCGAWYDNGIIITDAEKINGAMKIMTAYNIVERNDFENPEGLIDLCLSVIKNRDACDNFNLIHVLYNCHNKTDYKKEEIEKFCLERLTIYNKHYWPNHGGFSFLNGRANKVYYGAKISKGLSEPDIHATHLFLWGITLITKILEFEKYIKLKIPIT